MLARTKCQVTIFGDMLTSPLSFREGQSPEHGDAPGLYGSDVSRTDHVCCALIRWYTRWALPSIHPVCGVTVL